MNGLHNKLPELTHFWSHTLHADIILVQETHTLSSDSLNCLMFDDRFVSFFSHCPSPTEGGRPSGGVAILIRRSLVSDDSFSFLPSSTDSVVLPFSSRRRFILQGRFLRLRFSWAGHQIDLSTVYAPASDIALKEDFFSSISQEFATNPVKKDFAQILGGDWNCVESCALDRWRRADEGGDPAFSFLHPLLHPDPLAPPKLLDIFRVQHPTKRQFSFLRHTANDTICASRIDRFYISASLQSYVSSSMHIVPSSFTDHRPILLSLTSKLPIPKFSPHKRVRLSFLAVPALVQHFKGWLRTYIRCMPPVNSSLSSEKNASIFFAWWNSFKQTIRTKIFSLNKEALSLLRPQAAEAQAAVRRCERKFDEGSFSAGLQYFEAKAQLSSTLSAISHAENKHFLRKWLHNKEKPCPLLTRQLNPPKTASFTPPLKNKGGSLIPPSPAQADLVGEYFASISSFPLSHFQAVNPEMMDFVRSLDPLLTSEESESLSAPISIKLIKSALKHTPSGKAPGPDGLPAELYRNFFAEFQLPLSFLFDHIRESSTLPKGFTDGIIKPLPKSGDPSLCANYRPITLLNTDYRLLSKILVSRLSPLLAKKLDSFQTAFLPGRNIGDSIFFLHSLDPIFKKLGKSAFMVFCDFRKAYDTLDRSFLLYLIRRLCGDELNTWTSLFLSNTKARALVNNFLSSPFDFPFGVRQGDPLAPILYLLVAHALYKFLSKKSDLGITLPPSSFSPDPKKLLGNGYADDLVCLLESLDCLPRFLDYMTEFGRLSGQVLNLQKTEIVPIGAFDRAALENQLQTAIFNGNPLPLPLVFSSKTLGIHFGPDPPDLWPELKSKVFSILARISRLSTLSTFGRGIATSSYGLSKILYHMEFSHTDLACLTTLEKPIINLVERKLAPSSTSHTFSGLSYLTAQGSPRDGGFGVLPLLSHVTARHAKWGLKLLQFLPGKHQWVFCLQYLFSLYFPDSSIWSLLSPPPTNPSLYSGTLPFPLNRFASALAQLPPLSIISPPEKKNVEKNVNTQQATMGTLEASPEKNNVAQNKKKKKKKTGISEAFKNNRKKNYHPPPPPTGVWVLALPFWSSPFARRQAPFPTLQEQFFAISSFFAKETSSYGDLALFYRLVCDLTSRLTATNSRLSLSLPPSFFEPFCPSPRHRALADSLISCLSSHFYHFCTDPTDSVSPHTAVFSLKKQCDSLVSSLSSLDLSFFRTAQAHLDVFSALPHQVPTTHAALQHLLPYMGWEIVELDKSTPLSQFSVSFGTYLFSVDLRTKRASRTTAYICEALSVPADSEVPLSVLTHFNRLFPSLWALPIYNSLKEPFWRLVLDALPLGSRMGKVTGCRCGGAGPHTRRHAYWDCPLASTLRDWFSLEFSRLRLNVKLEPSHFFLMQAPLPCIPPKNWEVLCLLYFAAVDSARRFIYRPLPKRAPDNHYVADGRHKVRRFFYSNLCDFLSMNSLASKSKVRFMAHHPFMFSGPDGSPRVRFPPPL